MKGIFTERNVLRRVVAKQLKPDETQVDQVMTKEVTCCQEDTTSDEAQVLFKNRKIRHLPVLDDQQ